MNYTVVEKGSRLYIECLPGEERLASEREALDLVSICGEHGTHLLMLHSENLTADFYNLKTGVAGAILLKFVNYYIKVAAVLTPDLVNQGRFREMVIETNRGSEFRVFYQRDEAEDWLLSN